MSKFIVSKGKPIERSMERIVDADKYTALVKALEFYADPGTYFAILMLADPPCGSLIDDFSQVEEGMYPGKLAREVLSELEDFRYES